MMIMIMIIIIVKMHYTGVPGVAGVLFGSVKD